MITKMPAMTTQAMQISQSKVTELMPEMQKLIQDFAKAAKDAQLTSVAPAKSQNDQTDPDRTYPPKEIILQTK